MTELITIYKNIKLWKTSNEFKLFAAEGFFVLKDKK